MELQPEINDVELPRYLFSQSIPNQVNLNQELQEADQKIASLESTVEALKQKLRMTKEFLLMII